MSEKIWKPLSRNHVREDVLGEEHAGYLVRFAWATRGEEHEDDRESDLSDDVLWVNFAIYEYVSNGRERIYEVPEAVSWADNTTDPDEAQPLVHGFVKWDGCTQFWCDDLIHVDDREDLERWMAAIAHARRTCMTEILKSGAMIDDEYPIKSA